MGISRVLEVNEEGELTLPRDVLGEPQAHTRYEVEVGGDLIILRRAADKRRPFWQTATPAERAEAIRRWARSRADGAGLSDEAVSRGGAYV